jgi:putative FmdB family regulatory protein
MDPVKQTRSRSDTYTDPMPLYEFRCKTCDATFEERRSMAAANEPATCPAGHDGAVRLLSVFASVGASAGPSATPAPRTGGGCGTGCGCAH